jgi:SAM-dependent methyltransferase
MKPTTTAEVSSLLKAYLPAAALGAAMELGLFWMLARAPQEAAYIADSLGIPLRRCQHWLDYLSEMGLLDKGPDGYTPSLTAQEAILDARSQDTWALLAKEARERLPVVNDLALYIREPGSIWAAQGLIPPDYIAKIAVDPERARHFTRMLYELHQTEAEQLAETLDMRGVKRLMDLGGGSGVMSLALLRSYPGLEVLVVDQANVCTAGREIAMESGMEERITYHAANFLEEDLPSGFDMILECDVGIYNEKLFRKLWSCLNPSGRLVILDYSFETEAANRMNLLGREFMGSLQDPDFALETVEEIKAMLARAGFKSFSAARPISDGLFFECWR